MSIRALIFDFGGVLVRMNHTRGRQAWSQRLGVPVSELEAQVFHSDISRRALVGLVPEIAIWQSLAQRFSLNKALMQQFEHDFWVGEYLDTKLITLLRELRPHYHTAILSNAWSNARVAFTQKFALDRVVDIMVISAEEGVAKPDERIYLRTLTRLAVQPHEAIFVDDLAENVASARALGMKGIQFISTEQTLSQIRTYLENQH